MQGNLSQGGKICSSGSSVEERALKEFNKPCDGAQGIFEGLLGGKALSDDAMQLLANFLLTLSYPPNPIRPLDNDYTNRSGAKSFFASKTVADVTDRNKIIKADPLIFRCADCHEVDRSQRLFGTGKKMYSAPTLTLQDAKVPHLRFLYERTGYFDNNMLDDEDINTLGFNHGGFSNMYLFSNGIIWILKEHKGYSSSGQSRNSYTDLFDFLMGFDTNIYPMYGRQMLLNIAQLNDKKSIAHINQYVKKIYFPLNAAEPQCTISAQSIEKDGAVKFHQMQKTQVMDSNGSFSSEALRKLVKMWIGQSSFPLVLTCA